MKKQFTILLILIFILGLVPVNFSSAQNLSDRLSGRILLQVESVGQAWYIDPETKERAFLGRPADAFRIMRELGLGISEDSYNFFDGSAPNKLSGKILLRVEANGEAYYVNPVDLKMYYLGRPADAFIVMRKKGLGITNKDLNKVPIFQKYKEQVDKNTGAINQLNEQIGQLEEKITKLGDQTESPTFESEPTTTPAPTTSGQPTQEDPQITFYHLDNLENSAIFNAGTSDIIFFAFKINSNQLIQLNSIQLQHNGSGSLSNLANLNLYEYSTGVLLGSYDGALLFQNLNKTLSGEEIFIIKGNISSNATNKQTHKFSIVSNSQLNVDPIAYMDGLPIESGEVTIHRDIALGINSYSNSPTGIIDMLDTSITLGSFNITASGEDVKLQQLSIAIDRSNIDNGGNTESIKKGKIYINGSQVGATLNINEGDNSTLWENGTIFSFGSSIIIQDGQTIRLEVRADIDTDGTPFQAGETIKIILLAGTNNALSVKSLTNLSTNDINGNFLTIRKLGTISVEKNASFAGCESAANCQERISRSQNVKIGEFIIRAFSTIENLIFKRIKLEHLYYANDYSSFFLTDSSGETLGSYSLGDYSYGYCHINPNVNLLDVNVFSIYAERIADNPESSGVNPYQGIKILDAYIVGETTDKEVNSFDPVILQKLYIAP